MNVRKCLHVDSLIIWTEFRCERASNTRGYWRWLISLVSVDTHSSPSELDGSAR